MALTGPQYQQLRDALVAAFPTPPDLAQMVKFRLDKELFAIVTFAAGLDTMTFELIRAAEAGGWTADLIAAARDSAPRNEKLLAFSQPFGLASTTQRKQELEKIIKQTNSFLDVTKWRTRLGEVETQVCRIEIASGLGTTYGTGFLLGPSVVMTNYHVMEKVIENKGIRPQDVALRFDYKRLEDGTTLNHGTVYQLPAEDWLIDKSPYSPIDMQPEPKNSTPQPDELDYALLRVDGQPGNQPVNPDKAGPNDPPRKWIEIKEQNYDFVNSNPALFIMQHPQGDPLKLAIDMQAIIGLNANNTRVKYNTNTEPGSSGSPCFNSNWDLVALHHSGDPEFKPTYNEGIPFFAILSLLEQRGLKGELGEQEL